MPPKTRAKRSADLALLDRYSSSRNTSRLSPSPKYQPPPRRRSIPDFIPSLGIVLSGILAALGQFFNIVLIKRVPQPATTFLITCIIRSVCFLGFQLSGFGSLIALVTNTLIAGTATFFAVKLLVQVSQVATLVAQTVQQPVYLVCIIFYIFLGVLRRDPGNFRALAYGASRTVSAIREGWWAGHAEVDRYGRPTGDADERLKLAKEGRDIKLGDDFGWVGLVLALLYGVGYGAYLWYLDRLPRGEEMAGVLKDWLGVDTFRIMAKKKDGSQSVGIDARVLRLDALRAWLSRKWGQKVL
ncbi:hypothetical protein CC80DRAFT_506919 [Byssothecium circinans]|uniref:Uncharacterized protein n=1 Tax=Byssothecium circinans TaxID=147558 RepID=A0A6A5TND8_9PLEO|nr:hypothetical protein CC80DRAFT_506919 [Byssothecium circinans]